MLEQAPHGPCLVIAPTSVCHNWENELTRFAPSLAIRRLGAAGGRADILAGLKAMDVLVLSYGLLHQEADRLADIDWRMIVFDEAQAIKNAETRRAQAGQRLKAHFRVALTGTPIENYLDELWSLFAVINPGLLGSREHFGERFVTPIERNRDAGALHALRALIRPFMLRRTKSAVLSELPPRTEVTLEIDLPEDERAFYEAMRLRALEALAELTEKGGGGQNRIHILAEITKLRRACCHPGLIDPATTLSGAKLQAFLDLVDDLVRNKHKALVFSQFVGQLERVREALLSRGVSHQYLDGGTPASEREICRNGREQQPNHGAVARRVASISLIVGGIGIMNILLVSVTERTREIGLRMAVGARRLHVLLQFLVEAVFLSVSGGAAGIAIGVAVLLAISQLFGWPTPISLAAIVGGFAFAAAVGVFFGYYPARTAASLDPIEAFRYE